MAASLTSTDLTLGNTSGASIPGTPLAGQTVLYPKDDKLLYYKDDAGVERSANINLGTAVATTSGTSIDFTGIPAGVKRVTVNFDNVSLSATAAILIQLGDSGGVKTTAYEGNSQTLSSITTTTSYASGFGLNTGGNAGNRHHGVVTLSLVNAATFVWASVGCVTLGNNTISAATAGIVTLSAVINRVRITSTSTDTFDLGSVNISWEF